MNVCKIYVVRHGQSTHNRDGIASGHVNPELTIDGRKQAQSAKERLKGIRFDDVYSSDLIRTVETASIIFGKPVPKTHQLKDLRERNFGSLDGKPHHNIHRLRKAYEDAHGKMSHDDSWVFKHVPDMENDHEVSKRFIKVVENIAKENLGKTILIAAHGGTLRTMLIGLGHRTVTDLPSGSIKNASFVELTYDGSTLRVNDAKDAIDVK